MSSQPCLLTRLALAAAAAAWAFGAVGQTQPESDAPPSVPGQVLSDAEPLPAEHRDSQGAVVIDGAPVRAQQNQPKSQPVDPSRIGRNASSLVERTRSWDDVLDADAQKDVPSGEASGAGPDDAKDSP
ncbi:hypothetical protein [Ramlibacter algicola]|uniref:Uncharacterized protein n=1 Tax=Ramlibacter algicola TaxID=2795217 RepID=A0A934PZ85_9BURK|nr:hypothetical protein [Ramlibacter algicola]MBK0391379.1 hypothetical protein [Ramlibacter algicola]